MAVEAGGIGARLRAGREKLGLTVLQVAERIHTDPKIVEALEAENYEALGAPVYARGHIRHYAELVGVSATELIGLYSDLSKVAQPDLTRIVKAPAGSDSSKLVAPALLVIAVFAVAGAVWWVSALSKKKPQLAQTHVVGEEVPGAASSESPPDATGVQAQSGLAGTQGAAGAPGAAGNAGTPAGTGTGSGVAGGTASPGRTGGSGGTGAPGGATAMQGHAGAAVPQGAAGSAPGRGTPGSTAPQTRGGTVSGAPGTAAAPARSGVVGGAPGTAVAPARSGAASGASGAAPARGGAGSGAPAAAAAPVRGSATAAPTRSGAGAGTASTATRTASVAAASTPASSTPAATASTTPPPRSGNQSQVTLRYSADSWTEVYDASGARLFYDVGAANSVQTVVGTPPLRVVLGNAAGVAVEFNGHNRPVAKLAQPDGSVQFSINRSGRVVRAKPVADGG